MVAVRIRRAIAANGCAYSKAWPPTRASATCSTPPCVFSTPATSAAAQGGGVRSASSRVARRPRGSRPARLDGTPLLLALPVAVWDVAQRAGAFTLTIHLSGSDGSSVIAHETTAFATNANGDV